MSTLKVLKEYMVGDGQYLLNPDNNGKTVMLSGAWGSGKTHFWQKDIAPELVEDFNVDNRACVYVSLYGKESLKAIKQEVFLKASDEKDYLSEEVETFGIDALSSLEDSDANWAKIIKSFWDLNETRRGQKGQNRLKDGGLICFDDFERKSKKVDLNDLFGFISQLAIGLNCKVVIILNSDVFDGEEANVFKTVKEKTVNKFFYFEPSIEELFNSIYESNEKYEKLDDYRDEILKAIEETEELNARIYIQVLDNCLEWVGNEHKITELKVLVFVTVNFVFNNFVLDYVIPIKLGGGMSASYLSIKYEIFNEYPSRITDIISKIASTTMEEFREEISLKNYEKLIGNIERALNGKTKEGQPIYTSAIQEKYFSFLNEKKNEIKGIWKYGYELYCMDNIHETTYNKIASFVKTGILPKINKEPSS